MATPDHEFPWIVTEGMFDASPERLIRCTRCGQQAGLEEWIEFVDAHSKCQQK